MSTISGPALADGTLGLREQRSWAGVLAPRSPSPPPYTIAFLLFQARPLTGAGATGREGQAHRILPGWSSTPRGGEDRHRESQPDTTVGKRGRSRGPGDPEGISSPGWGLQASFSEEMGEKGKGVWGGVGIRENQMCRGAEARMRNRSGQGHVVQSAWEGGGRKGEEG